MTPLRQDLRGLSVPNDLSEFTDNGHRQPKLGKFPPSRFGGQNRSFSASYYIKFPFVEYSVNRNAVFWFYCRFLQVCSIRHVIVCHFSISALLIRQLMYCRVDIMSC